MTPRVSIISVLFNCDPFLERFFANITAQACFDECELICFLPAGASAAAQDVLRTYQGRFGVRVRPIGVEHDPGLYALWNQGIELARGEYVSNANPDDVRSPQHLAKCVAALDARPGFDVCATRIAYTYDPEAPWTDGAAPAEWIADLAGEFTANDLFTLDAAGRPVSSRNIPHCMPVWRKAIHERHGYFDEANFGPSADWEFWLRALSRDARGWLLNEVLGLYLLNPASYWRANQRAGAFDAKIIEQYGRPVSRPPPSRPGLLAEANAAFRRGDLESARSLYRDYCDANPAFGPAWTNYLLCLVRLDRADEFRAAVKRFKQLFPAGSREVQNLRQVCPPSWQASIGE